MYTGYPPHDMLKKKKGFGNFCN
ncbi:hypothetical protein TSAR_015914 [Trichomalopsis sarcophagae]|uniref:Uncharacterized protein n=1 Tax=Trichomalopsis sarcophagae TaxID=543379 RepID=A0A232ER69_9HYME|nr:hypothetical protein TSAR_015914 [Trichomalopsis sarcophagae]